jgi:hypothetical protein
LTGSVEVVTSLNTMQILANALPGFRDLRGPLIAGYMCGCSSHGCSKGRT